MSGSSDDGKSEVILGGDSWGKIVVSPDVIPSSQLVAWDWAPDSPVLDEGKVDGKVGDQVIQAILGVGEGDCSISISAIDKDLISLGEQAWVEVSTIVGVVVVRVDFSIALFPDEFSRVLLESFVDV